MGAKNNRFLIYILVAVVAGFIFLCWLYLLPYILKTDERLDVQKDNFQKINDEATNTLDEIKAIINDMGDKIKEIKQATSTQAAEIVNPGVDINLLKEKILEYKEEK
jgi:peptidoglycan hydrolase CwlO-like protein